MTSLSHKPGADSAPFGWRSNGRTDVGLVRKHNEDAFLERPAHGLWAVADGMGGYSAGDVASGLLTDMLALIEPSPRLGTFVNRVCARASQVNDQLLDEALSREKDIIGTGS